MIIPEFWCGVCATILLELITIFTYALFKYFKNKGGK